MRVRQEGVDFASLTIERQRVRARFRRHDFQAAHCRDVDHVYYARIANRDVKMSGSRIEKNNVRRAAESDVSERAS
jgi:hypothetical protein